MQYESTVEMLGVDYVAKQVIWTDPIIKEFARLANLSEAEITIINMRSQDKSITEQSMVLHCSESKINTMTNRLKKKYDAVQPFSDVLPPRKRGVNETYGKDKI